MASKKIAPAGSPSVDLSAARMPFNAYPADVTAHAGQKSHWGKRQSVASRRSYRSSMAVPESSHPGHRW
jgi:hypothetical protein